MNFTRKGKVPWLFTTNPKHKENATAFKIRYISTEVYRILLCWIGLLCTLDKGLVLHGESLFYRLGENEKNFTKYVYIL